MSFGGLTPCRQLYRAIFMTIYQGMGAGWAGSILNLQSMTVPGVNFT